MFSHLQFRSRYSCHNKYTNNAYDMRYWTLGGLYSLGSRIFATSSDVYKHRLYSIFN